jgi:fatty acid desaturase
MVTGGESRRRRRVVEWPTLALALGIYAAWLLLTWFWRGLPLPLLLVLGGWVVAWHSSLQHELIHGHPTRWPAVNRALGLPPLMPHLPFDRYRALHLAHHRDERLTDPLEDPETQYFTEQGWWALGPAGRLIVRTVARLAGRMVVGPAWAICRFVWRDAQRIWRCVPGVRRAWMLHLPLVAAVLAWVVLVCRMPLWVYALCFWVPGMALLLLRSYAEHRAAPDWQHRTAVVEQAPVLGLLYLFNNLHAAHHERPSLAWYRLPAYYDRERARLLAENGGLVYRGYAEVFRRFLFAAHDQSVHPAIRPRPEPRHHASRPSRQATVARPA